MAYTKTVWTDQAGQVKYTETADGDYKIFTPNFDDVTEMGTPVDAIHMNNIENGIEYCDKNMVVRKSTSQATGSTTQPVYVKADGTVETCAFDISNTNFDGQWVNSFHELSTTTSAGTYNINISSYLPSGSGYIYEVQLIAGATHSGSTTKRQTVRSSIISETTAFNIVGSYADRSKGSIILPVGTNKIITYEIDSKLSSASLYMIAYRRIGTNT